jgi:hypothetical protein
VGLPANSKFGGTIPESGSVMSRGIPHVVW